MSLLGSLFSGYKAANKSKMIDREYLLVAEYPMLHSSHYLNDLYERATTKEQKDCVLEHINRFAAYEVDSYMEIHRKAMDSRWK